MNLQTGAHTRKDDKGREGSKSLNPNAKSHVRLYTTLRHFPKLEITSNTIRPITITQKLNCLVNSQETTHTHNLTRQR